MCHCACVCLCTCLPQLKYNYEDIVFETCKAQKNFKQNFELLLLVKNFKNLSFVNKNYKKSTNKSNPKKTNKTIDRVDRIRFMSGKKSPNDFKQPVQKFKGMETPLKNILKGALQTLCRRFADALQTLCRRLAGALQTLCRRFEDVLIGQE